MRVLAIDPGSTHCGWVVGEGESTDTLTAVASGDCPPTEIFAVIDEQQPDVVVVEDFVTGKLTRSSQLTLRLVGELTGYCKHAGVPTQLQVPSLRTPFNSAAKRALPGSGGHAQAAIAHLLYFITRRRQANDSRRES